jgi:hypothetical protein
MGESGMNLFPKLRNSTSGRWSDNPQIFGSLASYDFPSMRKMGIEVKIIAFSQKIGFSVDFILNFSGEAKYEFFSRVGLRFKAAFCARFQKSKQREQLSLF